jgi:hypothetical protein
MSLLKAVVISAALAQYLRRHAVEALHAPFRSSQGHIRDGPRNPAVSIVEWMDGYEPEMGQGGLDHPVFLVGRIEPVEKSLHFMLQPPSGRSFEVNNLRTWPNILRTMCGI